MKDLLPQRLIPVVLDQAYLDEEKPVNQISKEERKRLVEVLKRVISFDYGNEAFSRGYCNSWGRIHKRNRA